MISPTNMKFKFCYFMKLKGAARIEEITIEFVLGVPRSRIYFSRSYQTDQTLQHQKSIR